MPYGCNGGYSHHWFSRAPYKFASCVKDVLGDHRHYEVTLVKPIGDKALYNIFPGTDNSCFLLPATKLCDSDRRNYDTVLATGAGVRFEAVGSRKYSIRVIAFHYLCTV